MKKLIILFFVFTVVGFSQGTNPLIRLQTLTDTLDHYATEDWVQGLAFDSTGVSGYVEEPGSSPAFLIGSNSGEIEVPWETITKAQMLDTLLSPEIDIDTANDKITFTADSLVLDDGNYSPALTLKPIGSIGGDAGLSAGETVRVTGDDASIGFYSGSYGSDITIPTSMSGSWDWGLPDTSGTFALLDDLLKIDTISASKVVFTGDSIGVRGAANIDGPVIFNSDTVNIKGVLDADANVVLGGITYTGVVYPDGQRTRDIGNPIGNHYRNLYINQVIADSNITITDNLDVDGDSSEIGDGDGEFVVNTDSVGIRGGVVFDGGATFSAVGSGTVTFNDTVWHETGVHYVRRIYPTTQLTSQIGTATNPYQTIWAIYFRIGNTEGNDSCSISYDDSTLSIDKAVTFDTLIVNDSLTIGDGSGKVVFNIDSIGIRGDLNINGDILGYWDSTEVASAISDSIAQIDSTIIAGYISQAIDTLNLEYKEEFYSFKDIGDADTFYVYHYDVYTIIDSVKYGVDDSVTVEFTFGVDGKGTQLFNSKQVLDSIGVTTDFSDNTIDAGKELRFYIDEIGDTATRMWIKIYRRE